MWKLVEALGKERKAFTTGKHGTKVIDCHRCKHYYVTWDKDLPHGCRFMGFKSALLPSVAVLQNSSAECLSFEVRERKGDGDVV